jgi:uncharacterized protein YegL
MKTMICLILDRSGSMHGRESDVIGGVNNFIDDQKKLPDPASMAFVRFDSEAIERFRDMTPLEKVEHLQKADFQPRGSTPLLDAVGRTITVLDEDWRKEKPERAIVIIVTDGFENASQEYKKEKIKAMIKARQDSGLWAFIYLGANVDAFDEAAAMGIPMSNSAGYTASFAGTAKMYKTVSDTAVKMRATGQTVADNLGRDLGEEPDIPETTITPSIIKPTWSPPTGAAMSDVWKPPV